MSIRNAGNVVVKNCAFHNNTSDGYFTTSKQYQGSAGGLSIDYSSSYSFTTTQYCGISYVTKSSQNYTELPNQDYTVPFFTLPSRNIHIINCTFINNYAVLLHERMGNSFYVVTNKVFPGRGGALSVIVNTDTALSFVLNDSRIINNFADAFGGGVYCLTQRGPSQNYTFGNNIFMNNTGLIAGGLALIYLLNTAAEFPVSSLVYNCTFYNNTASSVAGATTVFFIFGFASDVFVIFKDCKFSRNTAMIYGGAVDITSYNFFDHIQVTSLLKFINWLVASYTNIL